MLGQMLKVAKECVCREYRDEGFDRLLLGPPVENARNMVDYALCSRYFRVRATGPHAVPCMLSITSWLGFVRVGAPTFAAGECGWTKMCPTFTDCPRHDNTIQGAC